MSRATPSANKAATHITVNYMNVKGRNMDAVVTGAGGATDQLNLRVAGLGGSARNIANVPKRTAAGQTGVWWAGGRST